MAIEVEVIVNPDYEPWIEGKAEYVIDFAAETYTAHLRAYMQESVPSGRIYKRGRGFVADVYGPATGWHRASAPGEPPAPDTEALLKAMAWGSGGKGFQRRAASGLGIGESEQIAKVMSLELGSVHMQPRPSWRPVLLALRLDSLE